MPLRLILALLLALFATPGMATCCKDGAAVPRMAATMVMPSSATHQHHLPATDDRDMAVHGCIGCIPPDNWQRPALAAPALVPVPALATPLATISAGKVLPPALPPPRLG